MPRDRLAAAVATVDGLAPDGDDGDAGAGARAELVKRYATVRPFLAMLAEVVPLTATDAGQPVLVAVRGLAELAELAGRKRVRPMCSARYSASLPTPENRPDLNAPRHAA